MSVANARRDARASSSALPRGSAGDSRGRGLGGEASWLSANGFLTPRPPLPRRLCPDSVGSQTVLGEGETPPSSERTRQAPNALPAVVLAALVLVGTPALSLATTLESGPSPEVMAEAQAEMVEAFRLRVDNREGGLIEGSEDEGTTWGQLGKVLRPVGKVNPKGYTASKWAANGCVAATAVNSIHIKVGENTEDDRGVIFSLVPFEFWEGAGAGAAEATSSVFTDMPAGSGIFGGGWAPFINNPVFLAEGDELTQIAQDDVPAAGDVLVIIVERPAKYPRSIEFENRFGGLITIRYWAEESRVIGTVLRPVLGVGRFDGTKFARPGRIRANHCGVIDVSTSPHGEVGGFQIVPANHAMSPETWYIRRHTQWLVVGPVSALDPSWEGTPPLFSAFLSPAYVPADWQSDVGNPFERMLSRFMVDCRLDGSDWALLPRYSIADPTAPLADEAYMALKNVTHLRILFPFDPDAARESTGR